MLLSSLYTVFSCANVILALAERTAAKSKSFFLIFLNSLNFKSQNAPNQNNTSIKKEELYISTKDNDIIASLVLNNRFSPEYENINWNISAKPNELTVIHTFAIASNFTGKGIGREIFNQIKANAIKNNEKAIRVDIINGNIGAQKVFKKFGFEYVDTVEMFHEAVGLEKFHLYEYVLKK